VLSERHENGGRITIAAPSIPETEAGREVSSRATAASRTSALRTRELFVYIEPRGCSSLFLYLPRLSLFSTRDHVSPCSHSHQLTARRVLPRVPPSPLSRPLSFFLCLGRRNLADARKLSCLGGFFRRHCRPCLVCSSWAF